MSPVHSRTALRYNVRPLLSDSSDTLRAAVERLGASVHQLMTVAQRGVGEALAVQGLDPAQTAILSDTLQRTGGAVVSDAAGQRAVILAPLAAMGELPARLTAAGSATTELGDAIASALMSRGTPPPVTAGEHPLAFGSRTLVMGIVNVTPDSFSGDGVGDDVSAAVQRARDLAAAGAHVIDIGGESTRPNSTPVPAEEEQRRVLPVIAALQGQIDVPISIDTRKATVARSAIAEGATIVNDIWGLRADPEMAPVIAAHPSVALVAMHNQQHPVYADVMEDVCAALRQSLAVAEEHGISRDRVIVDPGFGFAKSPAHNLEVIRRLGELRGIGRPVLVGPSRKSTIGFLTGSRDMEARLEGGIALVALAVAAGADMVRVHDVAETVRALHVIDAVVRGTPQHVLDLPPPGPTG